MGVISAGTTMLDGGALDSGIPAGAMTLIKTITASTASTVSFVDGASSVVFDDTYKSYVFKMIDIHPSHDLGRFEFQVSTNTGSGYGISSTTTAWEATNKEGAGTALRYLGGDNDNSNSTDYINIGYNNGADNDQCMAGQLEIYNPASTTFVKNFQCKVNNYEYSNNSMHFHGSGYFNTTSAIDAIQFRMRYWNSGSGSYASSTINGIIKMYGIK
jgi:hypothetical protein